MTDQRKSQAEARDARLKQALRENLKRRKAQLRARTAGVSAGAVQAQDQVQDPDSAQPDGQIGDGTRKTAGIVPDKPTG